jgi:hypothetical protein
MTRPEFVRDGEGGSLVRCERCDGNGAICGYLGEMWYCEACEGFGLIALPIDPAIVERNEELLEDYMCEFYSHVEDEVSDIQSSVERRVA